MSCQAVTVQDQFSRRNYGNKIELVELICSNEWFARLQKSARNWNKDGHFTVVCSADCKARSSAENLQALVRVTVIR